MNVREYDKTYYPHKGTGHVWFDPKRGTKHFDPNWALLLTDKNIVGLYAWLACRNGIEINTKGLWGPHISFIKGEEPTRNKTIWGQAYYRPVEFWYSYIIRTDEDEIATRRKKIKHAWLDVWSDDLFNIRRVFGLKDKNMFHLTLGTIK
jgi:hypothetical protein